MKYKSNAVSVKYIGNSYFYITFSDGTRLATDPYDRSFEHFFGTVPVIEADVVTISHDHVDHNSGIGELGGDPLIIRPEQVGGKFTVGDVEITGFITEHVAGMGQNVVYIYQSNGLKIVHMGETDHITSQEVMDAVKDADVILAYAGQYGEIRNKDSFETLYGLNIKAVIPQHYSDNPEEIFYGEPTIDEILKDVPAEIKVIEAREFLVTKDLDVQFAKLAAYGR